jgi:GTP-binding protein
VSAPVFLTSAADPRGFPSDTGREVAFVGRSNSGKSTALNVLVGARKLARVSKTPGRTQLINFFDVAPDRRVVDLPGYGFARVPPPMREQWRQLLEGYFQQRGSLAALIMTIDIRRGVTPLDHTMLAWVAPRGLPVGVLLTKADKISRSAGLAQEHAVGRELPQGVWLTRFSAPEAIGVADAKAWLNRGLDVASTRGVHR